ncbi:hypothetical protein E1211_23990 [Micromonospora sp. 15K316]|uniref:hypothetical protein n=1 Tax=Micromonospora sp. 15K316 TaxID=2530376 RepID=UPI001046B100|nr:hypothetical protein [Micromonospora sp. 15K316]TDC30558.1 hypothetical protein E1211_23990 [Micromonospora sp. 15K316]
MTVLVTTGAPALAAAPASATRPAALAEPDIPEADVPAEGREERERQRSSPTASPTAPDVSVGIQLLDAPVDRRDDTRRTST